jgi:drug/metabolite transporter (DMT)-like permease
MNVSWGLFLAVCIGSRAAYAINDVLTGRLARVGSATDVAMWRGLTLGIVMLPLLLFVPAGAWAKLPEHWMSVIGAAVLTAISNILNLKAAQYMPFGLRAIFSLSLTIIGCMLVGIFVFGELLSGATILFCLVLTAAASGVGFGDHSTRELQRPRIGRGLALCLGCAVFFSLGTIPYAHLIRGTHPLLAGYLWELGIGIACVPWVLLADRKTQHSLPWQRRAWKIGVASSPTAIGTGLGAIAIALGPVSIASALSGLELIFVALLGALWHQEKLGPRRWALILIAFAAIAGIGLTMKR